VCERSKSAVHPRRPTIESHWQGTPGWLKSQTPKREWKAISTHPQRILRHPVLTMALRRLLHHRPRVARVPGQHTECPILQPAPPSTSNAHYMTWMTLSINDGPSYQSSKGQIRDSCLQGVPCLKALQLLFHRRIPLHLPPFLVLLF